MQTINYSEAPDKSVAQLTNNAPGTLVIAGPCSAESPEQLLETASALKSSGKVGYFRAGLWKPRTSPDSFQGVGAEGLKWLQEVKRHTGMKVATEVGCERHVDEALKYDVDMLWIGARTVSNPFVVQEIAEALRGTDIPVLVKNPLNPDIELWYGAIIRFLKAGVREVGAIHRGFSVWGESVYRNPPMWQIPRALRERFPGMTIVTDPSHIAGKRSLVPMIAKRALEEGTGGLMIEVHPNPSKALSDASQQLEPAEFCRLMSELDLDNCHNSEKRGSTIEELNSEIDMVDELLIHTIANRMEISRQIARMEETERPEHDDPGKVARALGRILGVASEDGLRPDFVHRLFDEIQRESNHANL